MEDGVREDDGIAVIREGDIFCIDRNLARIEIGYDDFLESASSENLQVVLTTAQDQNWLVPIDLAQF
jgi:hypothetical protein